jgi:hypothetical protein
VNVGHATPRREGFCRVGMTDDGTRSTTLVSLFKGGVGLINDGTRSTTWGKIFG